MSAPLRVFIETYGCSSNASDSETLAALLEQHGHALAAAEDEADVVVLNTCTVKDGSFRSFERRLAELREAGRRVVVAGCVPTAHRDLAALREGVVALGVNNLSDIALAVEAAAAGRAARFLDGAPGSARLELPTRPRSPVIEITPISQGCLSHCAFCETRAARGGLVSYPAEAIRRRVEAALERGAREIWLTSQDTAAWGRDRGARLADLLAELARVAPPSGAEFRMRLGMANPLYLRDQWEPVAAALTSGAFFRFLHFPLQSGSDAVLRRMKRGYTAREWIEAALWFRERAPGLTLATDVIVGFPGETEEDFAATLAALEAVRPEVINRSRYSPRPLSPAGRAGWRPPPGPAVRERSIRLDALTRQLVESSLAEGLGRRVRALVDQCRPGENPLARTDAYRPVALCGAGGGVEARALPGRFVEVEITGAAQWHWEGRIAEPRAGAARTTPA